MIEMTIQTIGIWLCLFALIYCANILKTMSTVLIQMNENLRILNDRLIQMNHKLDVIEIKLEKLRS